MQDDNSHLFHLGDLTIPSEGTALIDLQDAIASTCPYQSLLAEEDGISLNQLAPCKVQEWCLSRIAEHQNRGSLLHQLYGPAARNAISKNKSHIRALRAAHNDAAPIHRYLPPEMLMEVFSHVHPAVMPRPRIPVLRVCRYWRRLLFRTPRFWANLLSLPTWKAWNPKNDMGRFQAALARSASESLALSIPYSNQVIVDVLLPHAGRLSSFTVGPTLGDVEEIALVLEQPMPHLTHLTILHCWWYTKTSTFDLRFRRYPNIQSLELERTHFYTPTVPYPSLCHLKLKYCTIRPSPGAGDVPALRAMHNALEFFPNLESLSIACSFMDGNPRDRIQPPCELTKSVQLAHLRLLEIEDAPAYIPRLLSHLVFPTTTALVLEPACRDDYARRPPAVPLYPGMNPIPSPSAELSLHLHFRSFRGGADVARWETHGARPVRVTLTGAVASDTPTVCRFTRSLAEALAPAPAPGVTSLTVGGIGRPVAYWEDVLRELPGLRRFACGGRWTGTKQLASTLGGKRRSPGPGGELFLCPRLEDLALAWRLPDSVVESGQEGAEWRALQHESGGHWQLDIGVKPDSAAGSQLAVSLSELCDTLKACLAERAGHCAPIRTLSLSLHWDWDPRNGTVLEGWQVARLEQRLRDVLGPLAGDITVTVDDELN